MPYKRPEQNDYHFDNDDEGSETARFERDCSDYLSDPADWHTEALGYALGFSDEEVCVIKSEVNRTFQLWFGADASANVPEQFAEKQTGTRRGDPSGFLGYVFQLVRRGYYALEHVPVLNNLRLWAAFDKIVLSRSTNPTVQAYVAALRGFKAVRA